MHLRTITLSYLGISLYALTPLVAAQHTVTSSGERRTIECAGQTVRISGSKNDVTLQGDCPSIDVAGVSNTVAVDGAGRIEVTGTGNRVTWRRALNGKAPRISTTGLNSVERAPAAISEEPRSAGKRAEPAKPPASGSDSQSGRATPQPSSGGVGARSASADEVKVLTDHSEEAVDCQKRTVRVMGSGNRLTLRGQCPNVHVSGDRNMLSIEVASHADWRRQHSRVGPLRPRSRASHHQHW